MYWGYGKSVEIRYHTVLQPMRIVKSLALFRYFHYRKTQQINYSLKWFKRLACYTIILKMIAQNVAMRQHFYVKNSGTIIYRMSPYLNYKLIK